METWLVKKSFSFLVSDLLCTLQNFAIFDIIFLYQGKLLSCFVILKRSKINKRTRLLISSKGFNNSLKETTF